MLTIYRGDEGLLVKRTYLIERAKKELSKGTRQSYETARSFLLEASDGHSDPSYYALLADASAPWAAPDETMLYYERSLNVARQNLEKKFGKRSTWPKVAQDLFDPQERKAKAFQAILPYYRANFATLRVVSAGPRDAAAFVIERRSDGKRVRVVDYPK